MGKPAGVGIIHHLRDNDQRAAPQRLTHRVAVRQRHGGVSAHDPHRLHLAAGNGVKQLNRHQARRLRKPFRSPETRHPREIVRLKVHVRRQLICQPAHLSSAHRVWLSGQRKRAAARTVELPAGKMHVNDGAALVAAAGGLVDPHGVERYRARRGNKPVVKGNNILCRKVAKRRHAGNRPLIGALDQIEHSHKQPGVAAGFKRQMQVGNIAGSGFTRVNHHHLHLRVVVLCLHQTLIEYRMRPGRVRAGQHHQIAVFHILVAARHHVFAKGAPVAHHRRGHAEPGVGIDVRRADKPFHQLVGGIVVLG